MAQLYQYESQPQSFTPHVATATAQIVNGFVVGVTLTDLGYGYTYMPQVKISGGGGEGATAIANISNGKVASITVTDAGFGYTNAPDVFISSPPFIPWIEIEVKQVKVTQHVMLGHKYILQSSSDLLNWT